MDCDADVPSSGSNEMDNNPPAPVEANSLEGVSPPQVPAAGAESSEARLMITKLVLENFKSYAGVKTIGPFHKCFSAVIGPNGSGKSNVIDSMLFVFGKRASKLRLKKVSELIHKSSAFPNCTYARVDVHFVDIIDDEASEDGYTIVDGTETIVSRVARKDNTSCYFVNGKKKTFTEVGKLLRHRGIDLDNNRFLILQGEVEQISLMKPKATKPGEDGLLEYLEDIIGSNAFVEPIHNAEESFTAAEEARQQSKTRLKNAEKQKNGLVGAKNELETYLSKEAQLALKRHQLYSKKELDARSAATQMAEGAAELATHKEKAESEMKQLGEVGEGLEQSLQEATKQHDELAKELSSNQREYTAMERKDVKLREDLKHKKAERKKLSAAIKKYESVIKKSTDTIDRISALESSLADAVSTCAEKQSAEEAKLEAVHASLKGMTEELRVKLEAKEEALRPASEALSKAKSAYEESTAEITMIVERSESAMQRYQETVKAHEKAQNTLSSHEETIAKVRGKCDELRESLQVAKEREEAAGVREAEAATEARSLRMQLEECRAAMSKASSKNDMSRAFDRAMKAGGELSGVGLIGRLGDLGGIEPKYDVAISTACRELNHMVTETSEDAQRCVAFLRKHKLGRATFIMLDKIEKYRSQMEKRVSIPDGCHRLFDLVKINDERLRIAFFYGLRNTLVATDLKQATRVAYEGNRCVWRVVTLKGELIDRQGTMSGGGKPRKGYMGSSASASQGDENASKEREMSLAKLARDASSSRDAAAAERRDAQRLAKDIQSQLRKVSSRIPKLEAELAAAQQELPELESRLVALKSDAEMSQEEVAQLAELQISHREKKKAFSAAKKLASALQAEVDEMQKQMLDAGGPALREQKAACEAAASAHKDALAAVAKAAVDTKSAMKKKASAEKNLQSASKDLVKAEAGVQKVKADFAVITEEAMKIMQNVEAAKLAEAEKKKEVESMRKELAGVNKKMKKFRDRLLMISAKVEEINAAVKEEEAKVTLWSQKLSELQNFYDNQRANARELLLGPQEESEEGDADANDAAAKEEESSSEVNTAEDDIASQFFKPLPPLSEDNVEALDADSLQRSVSSLEAKVEELKQNVDMSALAEYHRAERERRVRASELEESTSTRDTARTTLDSLRKQRLETFLAGFRIIGLKLKEMYQMITLGGDAELELVDSLDPFSEGVVFSVRPKGKSWKSIANLSGGEKTLSSLSLVFALHHFKPTPLYVMDEIDAALDFRNVSIVANYIKERTKNAQFVIISLRSNMFELADRLVGIYKTNDVTKSVSINPKLLSASRTKAVLADATNSTATVASHPED